ncbi:hypothetical protein [Macrococcus lamae]|uniref:Uncharacterized protein n=1 Tax=Macrococcus lamae TaxID=198484 RepID=A0A4R6BVF9_9STAP|nr:hypothetical protein [Macrococcus lamae]TDM12132.1 hypothetical protein ERX29_04775 [Macrococcus lamae]
MAVLFSTLIICIVLTVLIGLFFNTLLNPVGKRIAVSKIISVALIIGLVIGGFYYWQLHI